MPFPPQTELRLLFQEPSGRIRVPWIITHRQSFYRQSLHVILGGNKGNVLAKRPVSILLKDCGEMARQVRVTTHGESDSNNISAFSNQATRSGGAAGVGLYFYTTDGEHLLLPDGSAYEDIAIHASADNSLTFYAGYVSTKDVVTAGSFQSVVYVEFNYL